MAESAQDQGGRSLEQILWRSIDRWTEEPALVDSDEFAAHIAGAFEGDVPAEAWVDRFFRGADPVRRLPSDMAGAVVRATRERLHVYEFDLERLEYVVIEDKEKVVIVSDFGQFSLQNTDAVGHAIESAVIPQGQRDGSDARAFFVRSTGEAVAIDVKKVSRSLEQFLIKQVSTPAVKDPGTRLLPFAPTRSRMGESREERLLRQDPRLRQALPPPPLKSREARPLPPAAAATTVFLLMADGSLARPAMGAATRWQDMVSEWVSRAARAPRGDVPAAAVGALGEGALARGEAISAVRGGGANIRVLGDDELAKAISRGAMVVPGMAGQNNFWVQPERAFAPDRRLGEITGDPWADWALMGGETLARARLFRAALDRNLDGDLVPPQLVSKLRGLRGPDLLLKGAKVVAFRSADGSVLMQRANGAIRLAATDRAPDGQTGIAARSGAIPATALAMLQLAIERTASAGGYKLPLIRLQSADDALDLGASMRLGSDDPRRRSAMLAGGVTMHQGGQVAQMVLSMPFPNGSEVHVGSDLAAALQSYLAAPVVPARAAGTAFSGMVGGGAGSGLFLRLRGGALGEDEPSGLPALLLRALQQSGDWSPGPGAPMPAAIRDLVLRGAFDEIPPGLVISAMPAEQDRRPINPGEDEIVIPMPLWSQMGRGRISATDMIMASSLAPEGYAPPLGMYQLVPTGQGVLDLAGGAPVGTPGVTQIFGPTRLELAQTAIIGGRLVEAQSRGGRHFLANVAIDDGESVIGRRGRFRIGELVSKFPSADGYWGGRPMAGALQSAIRMSSDVHGRVPARSDATNGGLVVGSGDGLSNANFQVQISSNDYYLVGLAPGAWSGARRGDPGYQSWSWWPGRHDAPQSSGGVDLSGLSRPNYPSLPTSLRFRYIGAPLWWSGSTKAFGSGGGLDEEGDSNARAFRAGVHRANSAASLWRSIFVASGRWGGQSDDEVSGGMNAMQAASLVTGAGAAGGRGAESVYAAMNASSNAMTAVQKKNLQAIEMSIVAAIPPAPPPLELTGKGGDAPHARGQHHQGQGGGQSEHKEASDQVSHSKIEGSVDAIAQRIYHRIRRRIQSDRERFGG